MIFFHLIGFKSKLAIGLEKSRAETMRDKSSESEMWVISPSQELYLSQGLGPLSLDPRLVGDTVQYEDEITPILKSNTSFLRWAAR